MPIFKNGVIKKKNDSKIKEALENLESAQNNCTKARQIYLSHLPKLHTARKNFNQYRDHEYTSTTGAAKGMSQSTSGGR